MYQLPLTYIRVSEDVAVCATRIVSLMSVHSYQARELLKKERQSKTLINACGKLGAKTVIILDNGTVMSSPRTIGYLLRLIEDGNCRFADKRHREVRRLRVYDVVDDELGNASEDIEEEAEELDASEEVDGA